MVVFIGNDTISCAGRTNVQEVDIMSTDILLFASNGLLIFIFLRQSTKGNKVAILLSLSAVVTQKMIKLGLFCYSRFRKICVWGKRGKEKMESTLAVRQLQNSCVEEMEYYEVNKMSRLDEKGTDNMEKKSEVLSEKRISRDFIIRRDANGKIIRQFEGIDMKAVYESKPLAYKIVKRIFDILISAVGLIICSPIFLFTAIAIKKEDGGPVFFSGNRWGKDFKYFHMHKFRSMCVDAEKMTNSVITENDKNGMAFKIKDDPRMTKMGKFVRRTSIDELPQLLNVLKGEMSLVGPRPIQTTTTEGDKYDMQRWCVKPGITCIWQVCGRADVPWDEWVEMDLNYINNMSLIIDLKILIWTVKAVLHKGGAI